MTGVATNKLLLLRKLIAGFVLVFVIIRLLELYHNMDQCNRRAMFYPNPNRTLAPPKVQYNCSEVKNQSYVSIKELLDRAKNFSRNVCSCSSQRSFKIENDSSIQLKQSACSDEATLLGGNQKVISYTLYHRYNAPVANSVYFRGVLPNMIGMKEFYPGWVMRLYTNIPLNGEMCSLVCSHDDFYYCDVSRLPLPEFANVTELEPMIWRILTLGDPTVEKFVSRDIDGRLSKRERVAVQEWEESDFIFHGMRDHPHHSEALMGGMWGANNHKLCINAAKTLRQQLLQIASKGSRDQNLLGDIVYSKYKQEMLIHDSYFCNYFNDSVPFTLKRENLEYVGKQHLKTSTALNTPCPESCRPKHGRDWEYC